jgi:hypothetical protein
MSDTSTTCCEDCGTAAAVRTYTDPESDEPVALCPGCARGLLDDDDGDPYDPEENCDDEFTDACITAADYMRADEGF